MWESGAVYLRPQPGNGCYVIHAPPWKAHRRNMAHIRGGIRQGVLLRSPRNSELHSSKYLSWWWMRCLPKNLSLCIDVIYSRVVLMVCLCAKKSARAVLNPPLRRIKLTMWPLHIIEEWNFARKMGCVANNPLQSGNCYSANFSTRAKGIICRQRSTNIKLVILFLH